MSDVFDLETRLQTDGVFWEPDTPDTRFTAHLSFKKNLEVTFAPELAGIEQLFTRLGEYPAPSILYGIVFQGPCTLIGLHDIGISRGALQMSVGTGVVARRFRVNACIMGCHIGDDASVVRIAHFSYSGIDEWMIPAGGGDLIWSKEAVTFSCPTERRSITDFCTLAGQTRVNVTSKYQLSRGAKNFAAQAAPLITIEPSSPRSLSWFVETANRIENFFSLMLGVSVRLSTVTFTCLDDAEGSVIRRRRGRIQKPDIKIWIKCDGSRLAQAIATWLTGPDDFKPLENLIYGTLRSSSMFVETEFLTLAQAVESLHRLTDRSTIFPANQFDPIRAELQKHIKATCTNPPIAERLIDSLQFANEPTFKIRIEALLSRISTNGVLKLIGNPVVFEQTLRQTRNVFTHPGIEPKSKALRKGGDIFLFNQKMHALLRLLVLLNLGFREEEVFEPVFQQSRKWRLF